jgi:hypothetical protein
MKGYVRNPRAWVPSYYFQGVLVDDPATARTDIEIYPPLDRLHFIAFPIARMKAFPIGRVSAEANPGILIVILVPDLLFGTRHFSHYP